MASKDTGMALDQEVEIAVSKFRARKSSFVIFKINAEGDRFVVDSKGKRRDTVATFLSKLPENDMRLCIMNHEYKTADGRITDKMFFIFWAPPTAQTESKMRYSADKSVLRSEAGEGYVDISVTTKAEIEKACGIKGPNPDSSDDDEEEWDPDA